jgi:hypothetical protein
MTLTQALAAAGFGHRPSTHGRQEVYSLVSGAVVGRMRAREAWAWLRALPESTHSEPDSAGPTGG